MLNTIFQFLPEYLVFFFQVFNLKGDSLQLRKCFTNLFLEPSKNVYILTLWITYLYCQTFVIRKTIINKIWKN